MRPVVTSTKFINNAELRPGDLVRLIGGWHLVTAIRPYKGPLHAIIFAVADTTPGVGFSLERGGSCEIALPRHAKES